MDSKGLVVMRNRGAVPRREGNPRRAAPAAPAVVAVTADGRSETPSHSGKIKKISPNDWWLRVVPAQHLPVPGRRPEGGEVRRPGGPWPGQCRGPKWRVVTVRAVRGPARRAPARGAA